MIEEFELMVALMDGAFRDFENSIPKPVLVKMSFGTAFRFKEKDIYQAILQKLAMAQSALKAAYVLLENGFVQEQAILQRILDETNEDILFLIYAIANDDMTDLHKRFLDAFWEEEIDESGSMIDSKQKRPMIPRKKIRAYIANVEKAELNPSREIETSRTISKTYSGFVHGASPQIMNMYGGNPPSFHTTGMLGTPRMKEHADDLLNYIYRTFISHILVAKALGAKKQVEILDKYKMKFEEKYKQELLPKS